MKQWSLIIEIRFYVPPGQAYCNSNAGVRYYRHRKKVHVLPSQTGIQSVSIQVYKVHLSMQWHKTDAERTPINTCAAGIYRHYHTITETQICRHV